MQLKVLSCHLFHCHSEINSFWRWWIRIESGLYPNIRVFSATPNHHHHHHPDQLHHHYHLKCHCLCHHVSCYHLSIWQHFLLWDMFHCFWILILEYNHRSVGENELLLKWNDQCRLCVSVLMMIMCRSKSELVWVESHYVRQRFQGANFWKH